MVSFWKETSVLITQGLNPFYAVRRFDSYVKPRVTYCMSIWLHQNMTSLDKMWWSAHKSIFGIRNYQVSKHVVSVLSNIWPPSLLYTDQVLMFLHPTARSADFLNPGNLAIMTQHFVVVRLFLVHKLSIENRDPDEIKAIYIQYARQSSVSTFKKEVDEYCMHSWQREIKQCLMYSTYSRLKIRNSITKMLAQYPKKISVKTLRVLMIDLEVREVLFRSSKSKTVICPICRVVDVTAHLLYCSVSYQEHRRSFIKVLKNQKNGKTLVSLLNCENKHAIRALAGFVASIEQFL